ncbi:MAG TPA: hypothetical protein VF814_19270 [Casimicrobiaceae bacterium]
MAGGVPLASRAQQVAAVLGHFGSANPQTLGKALGTFAKAFGRNVKTDFATVGGGRRAAGARGDRGQQHLADGRWLRTRHQDIDRVRREVHHRQRVPRGAQRDAGINSMRDLKGKTVAVQTHRHRLVLDAELIDVAGLIG